MEIIGKEKPLNWEEFEVEITRLHEQLANAQKSSDKYRWLGNWLFRGQSNSSWKLQTTLERYLEKTRQCKISDLKLDDYLKILGALIPALNSLADKNFEREVPLTDSLTSPLPLKTLELLYYLRHHGFPTPTLDWSRSYLVSAFFAFDGADHDQSVAIYAYNESLQQFRGGSVSNPFIHSLGPYVQTHRRHFLQQSEYTYCTAENRQTLYLREHDEAIKVNPGSHPCKKFVLAGSERQKVLEKLDEANINAYTLYGSEEGLMEMLAFRELRFN